MIDNIKKKVIVIHKMNKTKNKLITIIDNIKKAKIMDQMNKKKSITMINQMNNITLRKK